MLTYHSNSDTIDAMQLPGCTSKTHTVKPAGAKFPLLLEFVEKDDEIQCEIEFNTHIFDHRQIAMIHNLLHEAVEALCQLQRPADILSALAPKAMGFENQSKRKKKHFETCQDHILVVPATMSDGHSVTTTTYIVREAFAQALDLETTQVGCGREFFELGGSSILALRVQHFIRLQGYRVSLAHILELQSAERIAMHCMKLN